MSVKRDVRRTVKLTRENEKHILACHKLMRVPISFNGFVNFILERYGIDGLKASELFRDATK